MPRQAAFDDSPHHPLTKILEVGLVERQPGVATLGLIELADPLASPRSDWSLPQSPPASIGGSPGAPWRTIPIQREVGQKRRTRPSDQAADQLCGEKTEGDAVTAVAIGRVDVLLAGHRPDQG
jgi:hypothetical protein